MNRYNSSIYHKEKVTLKLKNKKILDLKADLKS